MKRPHNCHSVESEMLHITIYSQNGVLYITLYKHWNRHTRRNQLWNWNETETNFVECTHTKKKNAAFELKRFLLSISLRAFLCVCLLCRGTRAYECILTDGDGCGSVWAIFANIASIRRRVKCKEMHTTEKRYFELHRQTTHTHTHTPFSLHAWRNRSLLLLLVGWFGSLTSRHPHQQRPRGLHACVCVCKRVSVWIWTYFCFVIFYWPLPYYRNNKTVSLYYEMIRRFDDSKLRSAVNILHYIRHDQVISTASLCPR